jgi:hypothetical protein
MEKLGRGVVAVRASDSQVFIGWRLLAADPERLWRIDLGRNIRAGAHYTQFIVYDLDGDGRAEVECKTAPGTQDGRGVFLANDPQKFAGLKPDFDNDGDHRNAAGYVLTGYEFFTIFDGLTGGELVTTFYEPARNRDFTSGYVTAWGDNYGNRVDRFLAAVAYLDGTGPSQPTPHTCSSQCARAAIGFARWSIYSHALQNVRSRRTQADWSRVFC